jgi:nitroreductase
MTENMIDAIIKSRRSVYPDAYLEKEIDDNTIVQILTNAAWAPNHKMTEPWRFIVFKGDGLLKLSDFLGHQYKTNTKPENFSEIKFNKTTQNSLKCGCIVAVCYQKDLLNRLPEEEELLAMGAAIQNMWLSCSAYGIGCYLSTPSAIHNIHKIVQLAEGERCLGLFYMGWKNDVELEGKRSEITTKTTWIR